MWGWARTLPPRPIPAEIDAARAPVPAPPEPSAALREPSPAIGHAPESGPGRPRTPAPPSSPPLSRAALSRAELGELLERGRRALSDGDWWAAVGVLAPLYESVPDATDACVGLGLAYHHLNLVQDVLPLRPCLQDEAARGNEPARWLLDQLGRAEDVELDFAVATSDHFVASHPPRASSRAVGEVLALLEEARADVDGRLGFAARRLVPVVVYEADQFGRATNAPHWATGQYDGKIRVALDRLEELPPDFHQVLTHEYVHALVHDRVGARLPAWVNEGLANNLTDRHYDPGRLRARLADASRLFSLDELSHGFSRMRAAEASLAYEQSYWMTRNLVNESGWDGMHDLLARLAGDPSLRFDEAFEIAFGETEAGYLDRWYDLVFGE